MTHSKLGQNVSSGPDSNPNDALKPKEIKALLGAAIQTQSCNLEDAAWLQGTLPLVSIQCCRTVLLAAQDEICTKPVQNKVLRSQLWLVLNVRAKITRGWQNAPCSSPCNLQKRLRNPRLRKRDANWHKNPVFVSGCTSE